MITECFDRKRISVYLELADILAIYPGLNAQRVDNFTKGD